MMALLLLRRKDKPAVDLSFLNNLPSCVTFARASQGWYFGCDGLLKLAAIDEPRFDYDPETFQPKGLCCETIQTNSALYCRDMTNGVWVKTNIAAALDQTGIDGGVSSASRLTASANNATVMQTVIATAANRVFSVFLKRIEGSGAVSLTLDGGTTWTAASVTSSWKRFSAPYQNIADPVFGIKMAVSGDVIAADAAQMQASIYPTSTILTAGSSVTLAAESIDVMSIPWFNASSGSMAVEYVQEGLSNSTSLNPRIVFFNNGSEENRIGFYYTGGTTNRVGGSVTADGVSQADTPNQSPGTIIVPNQTMKQALRYATNDIAVSNNGSSVQTDTAATIPTAINRLTFCRKVTDGTHRANGWMRRFCYWNFGIDNTTLQQVTQ